MAVTDLKTLLCISVVLNWFCLHSNGFVIMDSAEKETDKVQQIEENVAYLLKVLEQLKNLSPLPEDRLQDMVSKETEPSYNRDPTDFQRLLQELEESQESRINVSKKDYAILPPASEWCRMMGFRRCRSSDSH